MRSYVVEILRIFHKKAAVPIRTILLRTGVILFKVP